MGDACTHLEGVPGQREHAEGEEDDERDGEDDYDDVERLALALDLDEHARPRERVQGQGAQVALSVDSRSCGGLVGGKVDDVQADLAQRPPGQPCLLHGSNQGLQRFHPSAICWG